VFLSLTQGGWDMSAVKVVESTHILGDDEILVYIKSRRYKGVKANGIIKHFSLMTRTHPDFLCNQVYAALTSLVTNGLVAKEGDLDEAVYISCPKKQEVKNELRDDGKKFSPGKFDQLILDKLKALGSAGATVLSMTNLLAECCGDSPTKTTIGQALLRLHSRGLIEGLKLKGFHYYYYAIGCTPDREEFMQQVEHSKEVFSFRKKRNASVFSLHEVQDWAEALYCLMEDRIGDREPAVGVTDVVFYLVTNKGRIRNWQAPDKITYNELFSILGEGFRMAHENNPDVETDGNKYWIET